MFVTWESQRYSGNQSQRKFPFTTRFPRQPENGRGAEGIATGWRKQKPARAGPEARSAHATGTPASLLTPGIRCLPPGSHQALGRRGTEAFKLRRPHHRAPLFPPRQASEWIQSRLAARNFSTRVPELENDGHILLRDTTQPLGCWRSGPTRSLSCAHPVSVKHLCTFQMCPRTPGPQHPVQPPGQVIPQQPSMSARMTTGGR